MTVGFQGQSGSNADIVEPSLLTHFGPRRFLCGHGMWCSATQGTGAKMKCLRVYSTADGESHFDEVEIPTTSRQVHPNAAAFEVSAKYAASGIRFTHIPAGARQVDWHTVPERVLTVRLDGSAESQTSDGDERRVPAGSFVLFEDVDGKGHKSLHSPEEQTVLWISLPQGLENLDAEWQNGGPSLARLYDPSWHL